MKRRWVRILLYAVLVGWCLLFLRCETTEKSMIRVVYLEQKEQTWSVGLFYLFSCYVFLFSAVSLIAAARSDIA